MVKKKKQITELREKSIEQLKQLLTGLKRDLAKILVEKNAGRIKNTSVLGQKRREKARVLTILKEMELKAV